MVVSNFLVKLAVLKHVPCVVLEFFPSVNTFSNKKCPKNSAPSARNSIIWFYKNGGCIFFKLKTQLYNNVGLSFSWEMTVQVPAGVLKKIPLENSISVYNKKSGTSFFLENNIFEKKNENHQKSKLIRKSIEHFEKKSKIFWIFSRKTFFLHSDENIF